MSDDEAESSGGAPTPASIETRLDEAAESLDAAETEAALDTVEATLDEIETEIETASYPDDHTPSETDATDRLSALRDRLETERGPYANEIADQTAAAADEINNTRWSADGRNQLQAAVGALLDAVEKPGAGSVGASGPATGETADDLAIADTTGETADDAAMAEAVNEASDVIADSGLDPDEHAETLASLAETADDLTDAVEAAETFDDLTIRDQLRAEGFFDVLGHYKDFPVEWAALKEHEQRGNTEMVLLALDKLDSEFLERHCMDALTRMNDQTAFEPLHEKAQKRDEPAIEALGKMAADDAVETLVEYVDESSNPQLQKVTFTALGEIGSREAVQPLANQLEADNDGVRPLAARALGMIGDTRAIEPLAATLADDPDDSTRAAAAWGLRQIGTRDALERAAQATADDAYIVQAEAERAADALAPEDAVA